MYVVEHQAWLENSSSIPTTMWWSLITPTTVGYGDVSPVTPIGKLVGAITAVAGVCVVALLTGIVATAFSNQITRRQDIFEAEIVAALSDGVITQDEMDGSRICRTSSACPTSTQSHHRPPARPPYPEITLIRTLSG